MKQIASALVKAQKGFAPALKTSANPFFKSKYADLAACIEAVMDSLNDNGIALIQHCHECETGVMVETIFIHESGESINCGKLHVPAAKNDPQGYGSALTYARRYSLMAACGIAPEDDDGNAAQVKKFNLPESTKITPTTGLWEALDIESQNFLQEIADETIAIINLGDVKAAVEFIAGKNLDADEKAALVTRFDSKQRSAMTKANKEIKESKGAE